MSAVALEKIAPLKLKPASGVVSLGRDACRGFAANDPRWHQGCSDSHYDIASVVQFQGQIEDEETGLYYNRHRYYDPEAGQYISSDPIGLEGGLNTYDYVPNPNAWIDPLGLNGQGATRRTQTAGDVTLPSARAARRAAMRSQNIPTSQSYRTVLKPDPTAGKPSIAKEKGLLIEDVQTGGRRAGGHTTIGAVKVHPDGHSFPETKETPYPTYEKPHYHDKDGNHISYESGNVRSTNRYSGC